MATVGTLTNSKLIHHQHHLGRRTALTEYESSLRGGTRDLQYDADNPDTVMSPQTAGNWLPAPSPRPSLSPRTSSYQGNAPSAHTDHSSEYDPDQPHDSSNYKLHSSTQHTTSYDNPDVAYEYSGVDHNDGLSTHEDQDNPYDGPSFNDIEEPDNFLGSNHQEQSPKFGNDYYDATAAGNSDHPDFPPQGNEDKSNLPEHTEPNNNHHDFYGAGNSDVSSPRNQDKPIFSGDTEAKNGNNGDYWGDGSSDRSSSGNQDKPIFSGNTGSYDGHDGYDGAGNSDYPYLEPGNEVEDGFTGVDKEDYATEPQDEIEYPDNSQGGYDGAGNSDYPYLTPGNEGEDASTGVDKEDYASEQQDENKYPDNSLQSENNSDFTGGKDEQDSKNIYDEGNALDSYNNGSTYRPGGEESDEHEPNDAIGETDNVSQSYDNQDTISEAKIDFDNVDTGSAGTVQENKNNQVVNAINTKVHEAVEAVQPIIEAIEPSIDPAIDACNDWKCRGLAVAVLVLTLLLGMLIGRCCCWLVCCCWCCRRKAPEIDNASLAELQQLKEAVAAVSARAPYKDHDPYKDHTSNTDSLSSLGYEDEEVSGIVRDQKENTMPPEQIV